MVDVVNEQDGLLGEVMPPEPLVRRSFKTLDALTDFIRTFKITHGGFAHGDFPEFGQCYLLEYPARSQE